MQGAVIIERDSAGRRRAYVWDSRQREWRPLPVAGAEALLRAGRAVQAQTELFAEKPGPRQQQQLFGE